MFVPFLSSPAGALRPAGVETSALWSAPRAARASSTLLLVPKFARPSVHAPHCPASSRASSASSLTRTCTVHSRVSVACRPRVHICTTSTPRLVHVAAPAALHPLWLHDDGVRFSWPLASAGFSWPLACASWASPSSALALALALA